MKPMKKARKRTTYKLIKMSQKKGMKKTNPYAAGMFISAGVAFLATGGSHKQLLEMAQHCVKNTPFKP